MKLRTVTETEHRVARAWYVKYPLDAYAMGPYRFDEPVGADAVVQRALESFGARPNELWPEGPAEEVAEYEYELDVPA